jgi:uncharacterized protein YerC
MTQVSKFILRPEVWDKILNLFTDALLKIKDRKELDNFMISFFSPTERIMLSKRLAIAVLLSKGNDYATIKNTLKVTSGTISKVNLLLNSNSNGLKIAVKEILERDAGKIFWEEIKDMLDFSRKGSSFSDLAKRKTSRKQKIASIKSGLG